MLRVCITGWYGTETLGDRAILIGIVGILKNFSKEIEISLLSFYPFFRRIVKKILPIKEVYY